MIAGHGPWHGPRWTRNDRLGDNPGSTYNLSISAFHRNQVDALDNRSSLTDLPTGALQLSQLETGRDHYPRQGMNLTSRLQWRLDEGEILTLQPFVFVSQGDGDGSRHLVQTIGSLSPPYATADTAVESRYGVARINGLWQQRLSAETRLDLRLSSGRFNSRADTLRHEFDSAGRPSRTLLDDGTTRERSWTTVGKLSRELASEHNLVGGWEFESIARTESRSTLQNGVTLLAGYGNESTVSSRRAALYLQDEWNPSRLWSAYAGLRWERIATASGDAIAPLSRQSAVWTPLLQALWKPAENSPDQVRLALTRSYKSPTLRSLIARPSLSTRFALPGANEATSPDLVGNPNLQPELATGLDLACEHYLGPGGRLVSINLFHRQISNLVRSVTRLQTVPWADSPRYVAQMQNVGNAVTQGIELEAKGRLNEFSVDLPAVSVRSNLSLFRSRVDGVPGPDNRLDEQPSATANLGADYRFRGLALTLGGNLNWTPAYTVQQSSTQRLTSSRKRSFELFTTWNIGPSSLVRLGASNLAPLDYATVNSVDTVGLRDSTETRDITRTQWSVRLEMKL